MYFKIVNQNSDLYKKLFGLRTNELAIEEENKILIKQKVGLEWKRFIGLRGQQNFSRVTQYNGFEFIDIDKVDGKTWKKHKDYDYAYVPNTRTKSGKEMSEFLSNGLKSSFYETVYDILGLEAPIGTFSLPFVEIHEDIIFGFLDGDDSPKDDDFIIVSKHEIDEIFESRKKK